MTADPNSSRCSICDKNRATHMCEDCGTILCVDCLESRNSEYYLCTNCHHSLGVPEPGETFESCPECGSDRLSTGKRIDNICPNCHSVRIVLIEEKRRDLAQEMRHAIMEIHYGHTKLRETSNRIHSAKQLLVSLRMSSFLHYKWLEDKIEECHENIVAAKNRISNQVEIIAKRLAAETKGLMNHNQWVPSQFPFIEGVAHRVSEICKQYKKAINDTIEPIQKVIAEIDRQLDGLNYYRNQFCGFYEYAELSVNELPVCAFSDIRIVGSDFLKNDKALGTLYVTNRRLVFIAETGRVRKKTDIVFEFPLQYFKSFEEDGRFRKRIVMRFKQGMIKILCSEQTMKVMPDFVEIARNFSRYVQTDLQRVRKLEQKSVNIEDVRIKIDSLVHALLSGRFQTISPHSYPPPNPVMFDGPHYSTSPFMEHNQQDYSPYSYKQELDRTFATGSDRFMMGNLNHDSNRIEEIQRKLSEIEIALDDTVRMFREGRLVPEDFTRRHRILMRELYELRHQINGASAHGQYSNW